MAKGDPLGELPRYAIFDPAKEAAKMVTGKPYRPEILKQMGADLTYENERIAGGEPIADIHIKGSRTLKGIHMPEDQVPLAIDEFPALFIAAACAEGQTVLTGAAELRVKESDRIQVMADGLKIMGIDCTPTEDGIIIEGKDAVVRPLPTIDEVFREVEAGGAHYGVVPVENSSEGIVNHTLDCFKSSTLNVIGEVELRIHHQFLVSENTRKDSIKQIYAHQQTLAQCRKWLDAHYPGVERVALNSNAEAARRIRNEWHSAAIASDIAASMYNLEILHSNIEDNPENTTRFLVIGREKIPQSGNDKTSLLISATIS